MPRPERETFLSCGEVLAMAADKCLMAEMSLIDFKHQTRTPWQHMIEEVAEEELQLALSLKRYAAEGPEKIISTWLQYKVQDNPPLKPETIGSAIASVDRVNKEVTELLDNQAEKFSAIELHDTFEQLRRQIEAVGRKISMIRVSAQDA